MLCVVSESYDLFPSVSSCFFCFVLWDVCFLSSCFRLFQEALTLTVEEAQEALVSVLDSRAKGILQNVKADAMEGRDERVVEAAERLLK